MHSLAGLFVSAVLAAAPPQAGPGRDAPELTEAVLGEVERRVIGEYYGRVPEAVDEEQPAGKGRGKGNRGGKKSPRKDGERGLPPGLAKRDVLPPGLQRQLDERGRLPPGLEKRALPDELAARLPKRHDGTEIVIVDRDVLLIQAGTGIVLDAIASIVD